MKSNIEIEKTPQFKEALALEGFLGKQRPGAFHIYQKRYCKFLDGGLTFAFADSKEDFPKNKLGGQVPMKDIIDIVSEEKPKKFQIILEGIVYKFEAGSTSEKQKWVTAIQLCRAYAIRYEIKSKEQMLALDSDIRFEESTSPEDDPRQQANFNPLVAIGNTAAGIFVGAAFRTGVGLVKSGVSAVGNNATRPNEDYLKAKKLDQALQNINPRLLKSRLMMGYVWKETIEATGVGLVDNFVNESGIRDTIARRWCLVASSKPIVLDQVDPSDEVTLETGKFPFDIEPEVLYIYDDACDDSKPLKALELKTIIDIVVKKKTPDEQYYRFLVDIGERKISFLLTNITEMTAWVKAIQAARANIKEKAKSKLPIVKNMYWNLKIMNEQGENKLRQKINRDYDALTKSAGGVIRSDNIKELLRAQEKVADDFIAAVNALLVHKDQRIDIIKIYIETSHELIMSTLRSYFKKNQESLENVDVFEIIQFLIWYCGRLRIFGDAFIDQRMTEGILTLCKIVGTRILKNNMRVVKNMIMNEMESDPEIDGRGRSATTAPGDIIKLINESFNVLSYCNTKELSFALLETSSHTLQYFQNGLTEVIDTCDLSLDQLSAVCNNAWTYTNNIKEFCKQAEQFISTDKETIRQYFDENRFNKTFALQGKKAYQKIADKIFGPLPEQWEKGSFLDIKLEKSLQTFLGPLSQTLDKIHSNFTSKIELLCLEKVVTCYTQTFLNSCEKKRIKPADLQKIITKLGDDQKLLGILFPNLKKNVVDSSVSSITTFVDFLATNYSMLPMMVQNMKELYGNAIKYSTINSLINLRNDKIEKNEKTELLKNCETCYKQTHKKEKGNSTFNVFTTINQNFEESEENKAANSDANASFSEDDAGSDGGRSESMLSESSVLTKSVAIQVMEGYVEIDKVDAPQTGGPSLSGLKLDLKYCDVKKDVLYFYKEKNSEYTQSAHKLKYLTDSGTYEENHNLFYIVLKNTEGGESYALRIKAPSPEKRDQWLERIREASKHSESSTTIELNSSDIQLFKDTKPLFYDIEDMPTLDFKLTNLERDRSQSIASRRDSIFGNPSTRSSTMTPDRSRRKKSFDINERAPLDARQQGCVARICTIFWKPSSNDSYKAI